MKSSQCNPVLDFKHSFLFCSLGVGSFYTHGGTYDRDHCSNHATGVVQEVFKDIERSHAGSAQMKHGIWEGES